MPASNALHAQGTLLQVGDGASPEVFTTIAEVGTIQGPGLDSDQIDVTNHTSVNEYREYIQGLKEPGELSFTINFVPDDATHDNATGLVSFYEDGLKRNFQMVFPTTPPVPWLLPGFLKSFNVTAAVDDKLVADVTIKLTGAPTF